MSAEINIQKRLWYADFKRKTAVSKGPIVEK